MSLVNWKIILWIIFCSAITAREINIKAEPPDAEDIFISNDDMEFSQDSKVSDLTANSSESIQHADCKCKNGECIIDSRGTQICQCPPEYGLYDSKECRACNCGEGSNCTFSPSTFSYGKKCICKEGYRDRNGKCVGLCNPNPCKNGGKCTVVEGDYKCTCELPFSGKSCDKECKCENGECVKDAIGNAVCQCPPEFGLYLSEKCKACDCGEGSNCTFSPGLFSDGKKCICKEGYGDRKGKCVDICNPNPCKNGGKCTVAKGDYNCTCRFPFSGKSCEKECKCENGECVKDAKGNAVCQCPPEFGLYSSEKCKACDCGEGSNCTFSPGLFSDGKKCICKEGYGDQKGKCVDLCDPNPCKNGGKCTVVEDDYKCTCEFPFSGKSCDKGTTTTPEFNSTTTVATPMTTNTASTAKQILDPCSSAPCQNDGECKVHMGTYKCECKTDYLGKNCDIRCVCLRGKCIITEYGEPVCQCPPEYGHYSPSECIECKCGEGSNCTYGYYGGKTCICKKGYGENSGKCQNCYCGPNAGCKFDKYGRKTCFCLEGYVEVDGKCKDLCIPNPCQNGGQCKMVYNDYNCTCKFPYSGRNCEKNCECENGMCVEDQYGNPVCQCPPGFGLYLNKICKACECGGGSSCEFNESGAATVKTCLCKEPYKKVMDICKECYCGPSSSCFFENYDIKRCICPDGHMEINGICKDPCNPNPCRNRGKCQFFKGNYSCACFPPYSGRTCEIDCSCGPNGKCSLDIYGKKQCYCRHGFAEFEGLCKECSCGPYSACFFNKDGDKRCPCENGYTYINGKCEDKKENIVLPALLGAILVSILFGILIFTCVLWKK